MHNTQHISGEYGCYVCNAVTVHDGHCYVAGAAATAGTSTVGQQDATEAAKTAAEAAPTAGIGSQANATAAGDQAGACEAPVKKRRKQKQRVEAAGDQAGTSAGDAKLPMLPLSADPAHAHLAGPSDPDAPNGKMGSRKKSTPAESGTVCWCLHDAHVLVQHFWASRWHHVNQALPIMPTAMSLLTLCSSS